MKIKAPKNRKVKVRRAKPNLGSLFAALKERGWEPGKMAGWSKEAMEGSYGVLLNSHTAWKNLPLACVAVELLAVHLDER